LVFSQTLCQTYGIYPHYCEVDTFSISFNAFYTANLEDEDIISAFMVTLSDTFLLPTKFCYSVVLKGEPLGSLRVEFLIPRRKSVPGRNWGGKAVGEKPQVFIISLFNP